MTALQAENRTQKEVESVESSLQAEISPQKKLNLNQLFRAFLFSHTSLVMQLQTEQRQIIFETPPLIPCCHPN